MVETSVIIAVIAMITSLGTAGFGFMRSVKRSDCINCTYENANTPLENVLEHDQEIISGILNNSSDNTET
jgi:hypothetical protein